jgi:hypothetical protein
MRTLSSFCFFGVLGALVVTACSSSNGTGPTDGGSSATTSPTSCTSAIDCNPDECVCGDGEVFEGAAICFQDTCSTGDSASACASMCEGHGGVTSIQPSPNVASSDECTTWCNKGAALGCGNKKCDRFFFCHIEKDSCEAAARAALKCAIDEGTWQCNSDGKSWSVSSSCKDFTELCTGADAGTD